MLVSSKFRCSPSILGAGYASFVKFFATNRRGRRIGCDSAREIGCDSARESAVISPADLPFVHQMYFHSPLSLLHPRSISSISTDLPEKRPCSRAVKLRIDSGSCKGTCGDDFLVISSKFLATNQWCFHKEICRYASVLISPADLPGVLVYRREVLLHCTSFWLLGESKRRRVD